MAPIDEKLQHWRRDLLDLSQRNRLLYFKPSRTGTVRLVEPDASAIYQRLVLEEREVTVFRPEEKDDQYQLSLSSFQERPHRLNKTNAISSQSGQFNGRSNLARCAQIF